MTDKYLTLIKIIKEEDKNEIQLWCHFDIDIFFTYYLENGELGYDFLNSIDNFYLETEGEKIDKEIVLNTYIYLVQKIEKWKELKAKGDVGIRCAPSTLCNVCKHRTSYTTCKAFPSGIPSELHNKLHTEKLQSQKNDIVFELGEEGSKNANIKPIKNMYIDYCFLTDEFWDECNKIIEGKKEEIYVG
jgi:hypothetical protein